MKLLQVELPENKYEKLAIAAAACKLSVEHYASLMLTKAIMEWEDRVYSDGDRGHSANGGDGGIDRHRRIESRQ